MLCALLPRGDCTAIIEKDRAEAKQEASRVEDPDLWGDCVIICFYRIFDRFFRFRYLLLCAGEGPDEGG